MTEKAQDQRFAAVSVLIFSFVGRNIVCWTLGPNNSESLSLEFQFSKRCVYCLYFFKHLTTEISRNKEDMYKFLSEFLTVV
jgi:hypothetical protein